MPLMFSRISVLSHPILRVVGTPRCFSELKQTTRSTRSRSEKASGELFRSRTHMISPAIFTASTFHDPVGCPKAWHHTADRIHAQDDQDSEDAGTDAIHHRDAIPAGNARENDSTREDGLSLGFRPWIGLQGGVQPGERAVLWCQLCIVQYSDGDGGND